MQRAKKVKVDMNPKRVQNPYEQYRRNPGKFDQKVYMEQENFSSHAIKEVAKIHAKQLHAVSHSYERDVLDIKKKKAQLDSKNTGYNYVKQLRQAFNDETKRRENLILQMEEFAQAMERRQKEEEAKKAQAELEKAQEQKNYKPWEKAKPLPEIKKSKDLIRQPTKADSFMKGQGHPAIQKVSDEKHPAHLTNQSALLASLEVPDSPLSEPERSLLEKMSDEIMCATLPPNRLKRIIPEDHTPVEYKYPIMSNFRRNTMLPEVKKFKRKMNFDTVHLHSRIQHYFGVSLPLSSYIIPKSAKPKKQKLLKAISSDDFRLPKIPPEFKAD